MIIYRAILYILLNISLFYLINEWWKWREVRRCHQAKKVDLWV